LLLRKTGTIILLIVLLFNMVGYRAWFYFAEKNSDALMEARLDSNQYDDNELLTLSIPLNIPYQLDHHEFVRVDGEVIFQGKIYKYVKRKVSDGNLILRCIPNTRKMVLKKAKTDYGNSTTDIANSSNHKGSHPESQKNFSGSDYEVTACSYQLPRFASINSLLYGSGRSVLPADALIAFPGKPPETGKIS